MLTSATSVIAADTEHVEILQPIGEIPKLVAPNFLQCDDIRIEVEDRPKAPPPPKRPRIQPVTTKTVSDVEGGDYTTRHVSSLPAEQWLQTYSRECANMRR